jgi:hypothetical protein
MGGGSDGKQVKYLQFVKPTNLHIHLPTVLRRPVPVEDISTVLSEMAPINTQPYAVGNGPELGLDGRVGVEELACDKDALQKEGGLRDIGPVVELAERDGLAGLIVNPMGEGTVEALGLRIEEPQGAQGSPRSFGSRHPTALDGHDVVRHPHSLSLHWLRFSAPIFAFQVACRDRAYAL